MTRSREVKAGENPVQEGSAPVEPIAPSDPVVGAVPAPTEETSASAPKPSQTVVCAHGPDFHRKLNELYAEVKRSTGSSQYFLLRLMQLIGEEL